MKKNNLKYKIVRELVKNKDVLDIGSVGQAHVYTLWNLIKENAKSATGVDIVPSKDKKIAFGNMEKYNFRKKFDIIVAGDVLEHVSNQGLLLDNIKKHLKDKGKLILSTVNAKWITVMLKPNPTHALWHCEYTLKALLKRHGFVITYFRFYPPNAKFNPIKHFLTRKSEILVVCKKK